MTETTRLTIPDDTPIKIGYIDSLQFIGVPCKWELHAFNGYRRRDGLASFFLLNDVALLLSDESACKIVVRDGCEGDDDPHYTLEATLGDGIDGKTPLPNTHTLEVNIQ